MVHDGWHMVLSDLSSHDQLVFHCFTQQALLCDVCIVTNFLDGAQAIEQGSQVYNFTFLVQLEERMLSPTLNVSFRCLLLSMIAALGVPMYQ